METITYTHLAELYGFRCYYNVDTSELKGTNWFNDKMIDLFTWIAINVFDHEGFNVTLIRKL